MHPSPGALRSSHSADLYKSQSLRARDVLSWGHARALWVGPSEGSSCGTPYLRGWRHLSSQGPAGGGATRDRTPGSRVPSHQIQGVSSQQLGDEVAAFRRQVDLMYLTGPMPRWVTVHHTCPQQDHSRHVGCGGPARRRDLGDSPGGRRGGAAGLLHQVVASLSEPGGGVSHRAGR